MVTRAELLEIMSEPGFDEELKTMRMLKQYKTLSRAEDFIPDVDTAKEHDLVWFRTLPSRRRRHGLSREALAKKVGISAEYIRLIELGKRVPSEQVDFRIREVFASDSIKETT